MKNWHKEYILISMLLTNGYAQSFLLDHVSAEDFFAQVEEQYGGFLSVTNVGFVTEEVFAILEDRFSKNNCLIT